MDEKELMSQVLELARKGYGRTSPNPLVGAVVINDGQIVGEGYHRRAGEPHAEAIALAEAGDRARGGALWVNLEPCCCHGRTPPCTSAIIQAGVSEVVCSIEDPNPQVSGRGFDILKKAGIRLRVGVLAEEARRLNEVYLKYTHTGSPFVVLKVASTLDGRIAASDGSSRWVTSRESRELVHDLRNGMDAVMVGVGTVLKDDPELTVRLVEKVKDPRRIVLDSRLSIPLEARLLRDGGLTIIATTESSPRERRQLLGERGVEVWTFEKDSQGRVDIRGVVREAGTRGITSIMIEGGSKVFASALRAGVVDKLALFLSLKIIGDGVPAFSSLGLTGIDDALTLKDAQVERVGEDLLIEAYF